MLFMFSLMLSVDGERKTLFNSEKCIFCVYEGTPQTSQFPAGKKSCMSAVLLSLPHKIWTVFKFIMKCGKDLIENSFAFP